MVAPAASEEPVGAYISILKAVGKIAEAVSIKDEAAGILKKA